MKNNKYIWGVMVIANTLLWTGCSHTNQLSYAKEMIKLESISKVKELINEPIQEQLTYKHPTLGFELQIPETWKGKYQVEENELGVSFYHDVPIEYPGSLFTVMIIDTETGWDQCTEEEKSFPYREIARRNGLVYGVCMPSDFPYDIEDQKQKEWADEYIKMVEESEKIITTMQFQPGEWD